MKMPKLRSSATEAFDLSSELLADLELERLPLASCVMKAARLARFIGDDEYPDAQDHYLEGFHSDSNDCYLSIEAHFNKEYIARRVNFSDGDTTDGNYFTLTYYNNERLI